MEKLQVYAQRNIFQHGIEISIFSKSSEQGKVCVAKSLVFDTVEFDSRCEPTMVLPYDVAQMLMDELWRAGLRPTEGTGSAGSLAATERHLKDMRIIVEKNLGVTFK